MARRADSTRAAFWRDLIAGRRGSGQSVAQVCEKAGVSPASFYQWQRKLGVGAARRVGSRLVPVQIIADRSSSHDDSAGRLEVELPGQIRLRIPTGCDRAILELVLGMLLDGGSGEAG
jgi:hypothetical protein